MRSCSLSMTSVCQPPHLARQDAMLHSCIHTRTTPATTSRATAITLVADCVAPAAVAAAAAVAAPAARCCCCCACCALHAAMWGLCLESLTLLCANHGHHDAHHLLHLHASNRLHGNHTHYAPLRPSCQLLLLHRLHRVRHLPELW